MCRNWVLAAGSALIYGSRMHGTNVKLAVMNIVQTMKNAVESFLAQLAKSNTALL